MSTTESFDRSIDLNALRVFVVVAREASFSTAATKLGLTKWSVSRVVSGLEAAMGIPLLHRTTRHVTPSPEGAELLERIMPLLSSLELATRTSQEKLEKPAGKVHLTIPIFLHTPLISDALTKFVARYPAIQLNVNFTDTVVNFAIEGFDLALWLGQEQMKDSSLVARRGWRVTGGFFASPAYLARCGMPRSLADLANYEQIILGGNSSYPLQSAEGPATFNIASRLRSNDIDFVREAVLSGAGIGLLPTFLSDKDVAAGRLVPLLPQYSASSVVYIIRPSTREVPLRVKTLSDFLHEYMKANPLTQRAIDSL